MSVPHENETPGEPLPDSVAPLIDRVVHNGKMLVSFSELITLLFVVCGGVLAATMFVIGQIGDLRKELNELRAQVKIEHSDFVQESDSEHWTRTLKSDFDAYVKKNEQRLYRELKDNDTRHWNATDRFYVYQDLVCKQLYTSEKRQTSCQEKLVGIVNCLQEKEKEKPYSAKVGGFRRFGKLDVDSCLK